MNLRICRNIFEWRVFHQCKGESFLNQNFISRNHLHFNSLSSRSGFRTRHNVQNILRGFSLMGITQLSIILDLSHITSYIYSSFGTDSFCNRPTNLDQFVQKVKQHKASGLPIVHEHKYVCEFPIKHRFCMRKFHGVLRYLRHDNIISMKQVIKPFEVSSEMCKLAHSEEYIDRLFNGETTKEEQRATGFVWSSGLVSRCRYETGGTILACQMAMDRGLACSTGGGTHHAYAGHGSGYCLINDMAIAANVMIDSGVVDRVLIVDLDVHQGDGSASMLKHRHDIFTLSVHCQSNFPFIKQSSDLDVGLRDHLQDKEYLEEVENCFPWVLDSFRPDLVIYDAGVDPHKDDELGKLDLTDEGLYKRDYYILSSLWKRGIPTATVIGGGYSKSLDVLSQRHTIIHRAASQVWMENI